MRKILMAGGLVFAILFTFSCKNKSAESATVSEAGEVSSLEGSVYSIVPTESIIGWEGRKPTGAHNGTIAIQNGNVIVSDGEVIGGRVVFDMNTITVLDQTGDNKTKLEAHLRGTAAGKEDDFFNAPKYPTSTFEITKLTNVTNDSTATNLIYGNLTIRDVTKEIGFKAKITVEPDMVTVLSPPFSINRADFGVKYGSKSFFDNLADNFVEDNFQLTINLVAKKDAM